MKISDVNEEKRKIRSSLFLFKNLQLDGELAEGELGGVLGGASGLAGLLSLGEGLAAALGELGAERLGHGLGLLGVEGLEGIALLLGEDGEDLGDVLAEDADLGDLGGGGLGLLGDAELGEFLLGLTELSEEIVLRLGAGVLNLEVRRHLFFCQKGALFFLIGFFCCFLERKKTLDDCFENS